MIEWLTLPIKELAVEMLIRYICIYRSGMPYRIHVPPLCVNTPACIERVLLILLEHVLYGICVCKVCQFVLGGNKDHSVLRKGSTLSRAAFRP
jgi:hypothetical protein